MIFAVLHAALTTAHQTGISGTERILREIGLTGLFATAAGLVSTLL